MSALCHTGSAVVGGGLVLPDIESGRTNGLPLRSGLMGFARELFDRSGSPRSDRGGAAGGFTLIELLAVIAMFALIAAMVVPNLDLGGSRAVRSAASDVATALEMARDRAIMTGRIHAVVLDLDRGSYWIEWSKPRERQAEAAPQDGAAGGEHKLALVPPPIEGAELEPLFGVFGRPQPIEDPVVLLGVELDGGTADSGTVELRMDGDGATDPAAILLGEADGSHAVRVEVEPLADAVHVVNVE